MSGRALEKSRPFLLANHEQSASNFKNYSNESLLMTHRRNKTSPRKQSTMLINVEERELLAGFAGLEVRPLQHDDQPLLLLLGNLEKQGW